MIKKIKSNIDPVKELQSLRKEYDSLKESYQKYVSDREKIEQALVKSESLLKESQHVAGLGTYVWDIKSGKWTSSGILDKIFGIDEKYNRSLEGWTKIIHSDWRQQMADYVLNEVVGKKRKFDKEYKITRVSDGENRWVHGMGRLEFDAEGNPSILKGTITDITERKSAQEALLNSESNLQALINNKDESIWSLDSGYNLIVCNDFFRNSYYAAYNVELKLGINLVGILSPELRDFWKPKYDAALSGKKITFEFDADIQGVHFWFDVFLNPIYTEGRITGVTALSVDITERKKAERELRESELRFSQLANSSFEGIGISDNGIIIDGNKQLSEILGYPHEELVGLPVMNLVAPESRDIVTKSMETGSEQMYEHLCIRKDGTVFPVEVQARSVPYKGRTVRVTAIRDITERKLAEEALIEGERKFRQFVETSNEGVLAADKDDYITFLNDRMAEMLGYKKEEMLGRRINSLIFDEDQADYHLRIKIRKDGKEDIFERKFRRKDGSALWTLVSASPIIDKKGGYNGTLGMVTDITDRKAANEILRESEERFRSVTESANDAIITADNHGIISGWNGGAEKIFGYKADEIIGKGFKIIVPELFVNKLLEGIELKDEDRGANFQGKTIELYGKRKNLEEFPAEISLATWNSSSGRFFTGIIRDITNRKKAEEALIQAKEKAEESDRLKSSFLANMSHEIRTPMNGILGFADLLKNRTLTPKEQQDYISIIQNSGHRMLNILNDLIDISKIESGQVQVNLSEFNLNSKTNYIIDFFRPETEFKGLKISLKNGLPEKNAYINSDAEKVNAVLINLVKNAIKFTSSGEIEFGYSIKGNYIEFYVKDTGAGVPDEQKEYIFERFRQGSESLTRNYEGAGLGLSISKSYVTMLGGKIWVENNTEKYMGESKGSVFYFTVPFIAGQGMKLDGDFQDSNTNSAASTKKLNILITEDDEASEHLLIKLLTSFSAKIMVARTGLEAINFCRNNNGIDLVLMDIKLPDLNGFDATRKIREFNKEIVIIAQTAYAKSSDYERAIEAGCNDFISKPISKEELSSLVNKYF